MKKEIYEIYTLIDVTNTGDTNPKGNSKEYRQQQNLQTFIQSLSMRTQVFIQDVDCNEITAKKLKFGKDFSGKLKHWKISFYPDATDPWKHNDDDFFHLYSDLRGSPVYTELDEIEDVKDCIQFTGSGKNTYINKS